MQVTCYMGVPLIILSGDAHVLVGRGQKISVKLRDSVDAASPTMGMVWPVQRI